MRPPPDPVESYVKTGQKPLDPRLSRRYNKARFSGSGERFSAIPYRRYSPLIRGNAVLNRCNSGADGKVRMEENLAAPGPRVRPG
jgi:hypothetical protein